MGEVGEVGEVGEEGEVGEVGEEGEVGSEGKKKRRVIRKRQDYEGQRMFEPRPYSSGCTLRPSGRGNDIT